MTEPKKKYSNLLKKTLISDPLIEKVHFDGRGNHHFNVYPGGDGKEYYGIDSVNSPIKGKEGQYTEVRVGRRGTQIISSISADEILQEELDMNEPGAEEILFDLEISGRVEKKSKKTKKEEIPPVE